LGGEKSSVKNPTCLAYYVPEQILFQLEKISILAGTKVILQDVDLVVKQGTFLSILGPSGAGKTTLLRLFNGLQSPTRGQIRLEGTPLEEIPVPVLRRRVGMLFQKPAVFQGTVADNLLISRRWNGAVQNISREDLKKVLEEVGLPEEMLEREARSLSGGEQQRMALARTLLHQPEVLLLDEPTTGLDPQLSRRLLQRVKRLQEKHALTVVAVSHDHSLMKSCAQEVAFLIAGRLLEAGPIELLRNPQTEEVRRFLFMPKEA